MVDFLETNPTEFIIMRVGNNDEDYNKPSFKEKIERMYSDTRYRPPNGYYMGSAIPTVSNARGKIVVIRDHSGTVPGSGPFYDTVVKSQDYWDLVDNWDLYKKWKKVKDFAKETNKLTTFTKY